MPMWCRRAEWTVVVFLACGFGFGCEVLHEAGVPGMARYVDLGARHHEEEEHREAYLTDRDPQALRWLLAHRIEPGMRVEDVNRMFGEEGEREYEDRWLKTRGGQYFESDVFYRWGPDRKGHSVILGFREGKLTNFDPGEYR